MSLVPHEAHNETSYTIAGGIDGGSILIETLSNFNNQTKRVALEIVGTKERIVHDGLIALGWTPPGDVKSIDTIELRKAGGYLDLLGSCCPTEEDRLDAERLLKEFLWRNREALVGKVRYVDSPS